jgi:hypothetical protein
MGEPTDTEALLYAILNRLPAPKTDPLAEAKAALSAEIAQNGVPGMEGGPEAYESDDGRMDAWTQEAESGETEAEFQWRVNREMRGQR